MFKDPSGSDGKADWVVANTIILAGDESTLGHVHDEEEDEGRNRVAGRGGRKGA